MESEKKQCTRGRPRAFCAEDALDRALQVFREKGYEGTSLSDLTSALGINRPSLYAAFGCKEELFRKVLARYMEGFRAHLTAAVDAPTAREATEQVLELGLTALANPDTPAGCLLVRGALACSAEGEPIRRELAAQRQVYEALLRQRFERGVVEGDLAAATDCAALARFYVTISHGLAVHAASGATPGQMRQVVDFAMRAWPS